MLRQTRTNLSKPLTKIRKGIQQPVNVETQRLSAWTSLASYRKGIQQPVNVETRPSSTARNRLMLPKRYLTTCECWDRLLQPRDVFVDQRVLKAHNNLSPVLPSPTMNKRLRKKLRRGEFTQYGFGLTLKYAPDLSQEEYDLAWDAVIGVIERLDLRITGAGANTDFWGFVTRYKGTCTEQDRLALTEALQALTCVVNVTTTPLGDAWR